MNINKVAKLRKSAYIKIRSKLKELGWKKENIPSTDETLLQRINNEPVSHGDETYSK